MSLGERLRELRERAGLTQQSLATAAGLSISAVVKIEASRADPSWTTVQALARALGVAVGEFDRSDEPATPKKPTPKKPKK